MPEKKYQIFYDMDNTMVEMSKPLSGKYSGNLKSYEATTISEEKEIIRKLHKKGLFSSFKPIHDSQRVIKKLVKNGYEIGVISQPMINKYCIPEKNFTLRKYFSFIDRKKVTYTFSKNLLANNDRILIDDHIGHLTNWEKMGGIAICFIRGYNKSWQGLSIKKHNDIFKLLEKLEKGAGK